LLRGFLPESPSAGNAGDSNVARALLLTLVSLLVMGLTSGQPCLILMWWGSPVSSSAGMRMIWGSVTGVRRWLQSSRRLSVWPHVAEHASSAS